MDARTKTARTIDRAKALREHSKELRRGAAHDLAVAQSGLDEAMKSSLRTLAMARTLLVLGSSPMEERTADDLSKPGRQDRD